MLLSGKLIELRECIESNDAIDLDDNELLEFMSLLAQELRARLPEQAMRQGDLPESYESAIRVRQQLAAIIKDAEIHPELHDDDSPNEGEVEMDAYFQMQEDMKSGECYVIHDNGIVTICGTQIAKMNGDNRDEVIDQIKATMQHQGYYPNVYSVNDHGNVTLLGGENYDEAIHSWV